MDFARKSIAAKPAASAERQPSAYQVRNAYGGKWHEADEATFNVVREMRTEDARKLYTAPIATQPIESVKAPNDKDIIDLSPKHT